MGDTDKLKADIGKLKQEVAAKKKESKDLRGDPDLRKVRKSLKRAQRKLARQTVVAMPDQVAKAQKLMDLLGKSLDTFTKEHKKPSGDPHVHSLRKKIRSLNRKIKRLNRRQAKHAAKAEEKPVEKKEEPKSGS